MSNFYLVKLVALPLSYTGRPILVLGLVGKGGRGLILVEFLSVMSEEAPIPPAPGCEAAQSNHGNPQAGAAAVKGEKTKLEHYSNLAQSFTNFKRYSNWKSLYLA